MPQQCIGIIKLIQQELVEEKLSQAKKINYLKEKKEKSSNLKNIYIDSEYEYKLKFIVFI